MTQTHPNAMLVGPIATDAENEERFVFVVIRGCDCGNGPHVHCVETDNAMLLDSLRAGWLVSVAHTAPDELELAVFEEDLAMLQAAAVLWPADFGSAAAAGEVRAAGGGRA